MTKAYEEREELRRKVKLLKAWKRLENNADFKSVILNGFCKDEVIRLNRLASLEPKPEIRLSRSQAAMAAPVLEEYLVRLANEGETAEANLPEFDNIVREEELGDDR